MEVETINWDTVNQAVNKISDTFKDKHIDCIIALMRGGLVLGTMVSHRLNIPMRCIGLSSYNEDNKQEKIIVYQKVKLDKNFKIVLVIDDIIDSGKTIKYIKNKIEKKHTKTKFYYTTMYATDKHKDNVDYYCYDKNDKWLMFPWETNDE